MPCRTTTAIGCRRPPIVTWTCPPSHLHSPHQIGSLLCIHMGYSAAWRSTKLHPWRPRSQSTLKRPPSGKWWSWSGRRTCQLCAATCFGCIFAALGRSRDLEAILAGQWVCLDGFLQADLWTVETGAPWFSSKYPWVPSEKSSVRHQRISALTAAVAPSKGVKMKARRSQPQRDPPRGQQAPGPHGVAWWRFRWKRLSRYQDFAPTPHDILGISSFDSWLVFTKEWILYWNVQYIRFSFYLYIYNPDGIHRIYNR